MTSKCVITSAAPAILFFLFTAAYCLCYFKEFNSKSSNDFSTVLIEHSMGLDWRKHADYGTTLLTLTQYLQKMRYLTNFCGTEVQWTV